MESPIAREAWVIFVALCLIGGAVAAFSPNPSEVNQIRSRMMYPYRDSDFQADITSIQSAQEKSLSFHMPYFGFAFNYTTVAVHGALFFSREQTTIKLPMEFPAKNWPEVADPAFIGIYYGMATIGQNMGDDKLRSGMYFRTYPQIGNRFQEDANLKEAIRLDIIEGMIGATDFEPQHVAIITWKNITFTGAPSNDKLNTYQLVLATDQIRTYAIINYELINWASTSGQDGDKGIPVFVGFNAGNGTRAFEYKPYSQSRRITDLMYNGLVNNFPGRHIFRIDEEILQGSCNYEPADYPLLVISPETGHMLGGVIVNITGPCFVKGEKIRLRFSDKEINCQYRSRNMASCVTPTVYTAGYVEMSVIQGGGGTMLFKNKYYVENPMVAFESIRIEKEDMTKKELDSFRLLWSRRNLTWGLESVSINLYGYRESSMRPELVFIQSLVDETPNDGNEELMVDQFIGNNNGWLREFRIGLIQINLTNPDPNYLIHSPALWSRPIPLAWYFNKQWKDHYGSNWAEKFCEQWDSDDQRLNNFAHEVPRCPCTREQANVDLGRYAPDFGCDEWGSRECYGNPKIVHCVRSGQPSQDGGGQQCCYGMTGNLMMNSDMIEGGFPSRSHPFGVFPFDDNTKVPGLSHWYHDMTAYYTCCKWQNEMSEGCYQFKWRRASQDCIGYQPPNASLVFGDPHFITFDNLEYTFNGLGEYALLNVQDPTHVLEVQGRFERIIDKRHKLDAAQLTAIVAKDEFSNVVEVQLRPQEARWRYRLNVLVEGKRIYFDRPALKIQSFRDVTVYTPFNVLNQSRIVIMFTSGAGVEVLENDGYMSARIYLPKSFMNITRGLMGNWSNEVTDDLAFLPESQKDPFPSTSSMRDIYNHFGKEWFVDTGGKADIKGTTSRFYHEFGRGTDFYTDPKYTPKLDKEPTFNNSGTSISIEDVDRICGEKTRERNYQCRFDFIVTLNEKFARSTKLSGDIFRQMKNRDLKSIVTCGALQTPRHGRKTSNDYTVGTVVKFECEKGYVLEGEPVRWCYASGEWSWAEWGITRCTPEDTYYAKQAGITSGIVLGVLIPCFIGGICLFGYIISKGPAEQTSREWRRGADSRAVNIQDENEKKKGSKVETDA